MKIGILEIITLPSSTFSEWLYNPVISKQMMAITPQAISVWCRRMGHETHYTTYYGFGKIENFLPKDLDIIFIACTTQQSPVAYAMAKIYKKMGIRTVIGGPHAIAFPKDCLRYFDLAVGTCDENLIKNIVNGEFEPGSCISSKESYKEIPTIEERFPEIRKSAYYFGKLPAYRSIVPMMTSIGCPYTCDFCVDWKNPYEMLSMDQFKEDLSFLSKNLPGMSLSFCDPNFAIKFDQVFDVLESVPKESRLPYFMNCSQSVLTPERIKRIKDSNCQFLMLGIESWSEYSAKIGMGRKNDADKKLQRSLENFHILGEHKWFVGANFIFGLDGDIGDEPVDMTKEFIRQTPHSWPAVNIPSPFGGTPLHDRIGDEGRILKEMPFAFYSTPYLAITLKNYDPETYYSKMAEISDLTSSDEMMEKRLKFSPGFKFKAIYKLRRTGEKYFTNFYKGMVERLRTDKKFRAFHEQENEQLPEYYHQEFDRRLGAYATLIPREERTPNTEMMTPLIN